MIADQTCKLLINAADTFDIALPDYVVAAQELHDAAVQYVDEVATATEPTFDGIVAPKDIAKTVDAMLAWPAHDERLALANRVEVEARVRLNACVDRFRGGMSPALGERFNTAAADFAARYDAGQDQDALTVSLLADLVRVRDLLVAGRVDEGFPMTHSDEPTRVVVWQSCDDMFRFRNRANNLDRGSRQWIELALSLGGRLRWQTRDEQIAHVAALARPFAAPPRPSRFATAEDFARGGYALADDAA